MARTVRISDEEIQHARKLRDEARSVAELRSALSVLLMAEHGFGADQAAELLGISRRTFFRNRGNIRHQGGLVPKSWGGRRRFSLTFEEEQEFLSSWEKKATSGGVLSVSPIHDALVERLGHSTSISTTYRMLTRHGWRKVQPNTKHLKNDPAVQEEFKKKPQKFWLPPV